VKFKGGGKSPSGSGREEDLAIKLLARNRMAAGRVGGSSKGGGDLRKGSLLRLTGGRPCNTWGEPQCIRFLRSLGPRNNGLPRDRLRLLDYCAHGSRAPRELEKNTRTGRLKLEKENTGIGGPKETSWGAKVILK